jgi:hypothetical protein
MSKFDAVIDILKVELSWAETRGWCPDKNKINQLCSAIRVLEAAGKIGSARQHLLDYIGAERGFEEEIGNLSSAEAMGNLLGVLSALPDPATEAKQ